MRIDQTNLRVANDVVRDILFMYRDMVVSYGGFGSDIDTGTFDPFELVNVYVVETPGLCSGVDQALLTAGAGIAILCGMLDAWDQEDPDVVHKTEWFNRAREVVRGDALTEFPDIAEAIEAGLTSVDEMHSRLPELFSKYVRAYFEKLASS